MQECDCRTSRDSKQQPCPNCGDTSHTVSDCPHGAEVGSRYNARPMRTADPYDDRRIQRNMHGEGRGDRGRGDFPWRNRGGRGAAWSGAARGASQWKGSRGESEQSASGMTCSANDSTCENFNISTNVPDPTASYVEYSMMFAFGFTLATAILGPVRMARPIRHGCMRTISAILHLMSVALFQLSCLASSGFQWWRGVANDLEMKTRGTQTLRPPPVSFNVGCQTDPLPPPPPPPVQWPRQPVWVTDHGRVWHATNTCQAAICSYGARRKEPCMKCVGRLG